MKRIFFAFALFALPSFPVRAQQPKSLFYLTRDPKSVRSFLAHADKIDILVPAWYSVDGDGLVSGGPNPLVLETARLHHVPVMPIVANGGFSQEDIHNLAMNRSAYETMSACALHARKTATSGSNLISRTSIGRIAMHSQLWSARSRRNFTPQNSS